MVMNDDEYRKVLLKQLGNARTPAAAEYFRWMYSLVETVISESDSVLEIGSGAGVSSLFLKNKNVLRTDLLNHNLNGIQSGVNAEMLPFETGKFEAALAVDMLHHVPFPHMVVDELIRVTNGGGKIVIVEPFVSALSVFAYKLFHPEKTSIFLKFSTKEPMVGQRSADGDQIICQKLFFSKTGKNYLRATHKGNLRITRHLISPLSFFLTGGVNRPLGISPKVIGMTIKLENRIPTAVMRCIASRQIVVIEKINCRS
jgi:SAM-dependent methyltransferase